MLKAKIEALIYAAEEPITLDQLAALLKEDLLALKAASQSPAVEPDPAPREAAPAKDQKRPQKKSERAELRELLRPLLQELMADYAREERGIEVRQVAGGYRMSTKPEHHDVIRAFSKSLKPP
ncbi:MAG TPA: SMC-Scp complex subunit ScpB, partial [Candidatus Angelobacter sp.]